MLTTLLEPTAGEATVAGCDLRADPVGVRRDIGYVPQSGSTLPEARVGEELVDHAAAVRHAHRGGPRPRRASCSPSSTSRASGPAGQDAVRRPAPPARHRDGPDPRAAAGLPRRADHRPRPAVPGQPLGAHPRLRDDARDHGLPDHALPRRGRRALRPDPGHRPRHDRRRAARRTSSSARVSGDAVAADPGRRGQAARSRGLATAAGRGAAAGRRRPGAAATASCGCGCRTAAPRCPGCCASWTRTASRSLAVEVRRPTPRRRVPVPDRAVAARRRDARPEARPPMSDR